MEALVLGGLRRCGAAGGRIGQRQPRGVRLKFRGDAVGSLGLGRGRERPQVSSGGLAAAPTELLSVRVGVGRGSADGGMVLCAEIGAVRQFYDIEQHF